MALNYPRAIIYPGSARKLGLYAFSRARFAILSELFSTYGFKTPRRRHRNIEVLLGSRKSPTA